jgi:hypothetical protein
MLNLDTEEWGELYVGCMGSRESTITIPCSCNKNKNNTNNTNNHQQSTAINNNQQQQWDSPTSVLERASLPGTGWWFGRPT